MVLCTAAAAVAIQTKAVDRVVAWSSGIGAWNVNGLLALIFLLPVAATIFAYRRYHEAASVRLELAHLSLHDSLTGLPNRLYLTDWLDESLKQSRRSNCKVAVLFIDLDKFKMVNDTYGHEVGDQLMVAVAARLRSTLRPEDRVVRYGGDEFVAICRDVTHAPAAERVAGRIIEALETPFELGQDLISISSSIGIALTEDRSASTEEIIRDADAAMYEAKAKGSGSFLTFDRTMRNHITRATGEARLREALENSEFVLHYQPVVAVGDESLIGVEALIRWEDPERGMIPPGEFVPILEDTGLIVPVGTWVLKEACRQARMWRDSYPDRRPLKVTVNVSARQLAQANFREVITQALQESGADPDLLCLEITEGALMYDVSAAWAMLRRAKSLGVALALDDFGTGYSSLSYIRRFSLDLLKIDRSFVEGLGQSREDTAIVEHVIGMAQALGMVTVGEGVETPEQLAELRRLRCDLAQGYLFSKPVPVHQIDALLRRQARAAARSATAAATSAPAGPVPAGPAAPAASSPSAPARPAVPPPAAATSAPAPPPPLPSRVPPDPPVPVEEDAPALALPRLRPFQPQSSPEPQPR